MSISLRVRLAAAAVLGLAAGAVAWSRLEPMLPFLDIRTVRTADEHVWDVVVTGRGETIDEVTIQPAHGPLQVIGRTSVRGLESSRTATFQVRIDGDTPAGCAVWINQTAPGSHTYEIAIGVGQ